MHVTQSYVTSPHSCPNRTRSVQDADCRPDTKCRLGTKCRLQTEYKMETDKKNCFFYVRNVSAFDFITCTYCDPIVTQSPHNLRILGECTQLLCFQGVFGLKREISVLYKIETLVLQFDLRTSHWRWHCKVTA